MIIVIGDQHYSLVGLEDVSLKHWLQLQRELTVTGISGARSIDEIKDTIGEFARLSRAEQLRHPEGLFLTSVTVWAARVTAGEDLSLLDAVDVPMSELRFVAEPTDRKPGDDPGKAAGGGPNRAARRRRRRTSAPRSPAAS